MEKEEIEQPFDAVRQKLVDAISPLCATYLKPNTKKFEYWKGFSDCISTFDNAVFDLQRTDSGVQWHQEQAGRGSFLDVLEENYQALVDQYKGDVLKSTAYIVLAETYEDLISIYKANYATSQQRQGEWITLEDAFLKLLEKFIIADGWKSQEMEKTLRNTWLTHAGLTPPQK